MFSKFHKLVNSKNTEKIINLNEILDLDFKN